MAIIGRRKRKQEERQLIEQQSLGCGNEIFHLLKGSNL